MIFLWLVLYYLWMLSSLSLLQVETTAKKSNHKPKQSNINPSSPIKENTEDLVADFGLDDSPGTNN